MPTHCAITYKVRDSIETINVPATDVKDIETAGNSVFVTVELPNGKVTSKYAKSIEYHQV